MKISAVLPTRDLQTLETKQIFYVKDGKRRFPKVWCFVHNKAYLDVSPEVRARNQTNVLKNRFPRITNLTFGVEAKKNDGYEYKSRDQVFLPEDVTSLA